MSALVQCIVHCGPLREHLLHIPAPEPSRLCVELKEVVQQYVHGRPSEDGERMLKFDVLAPHALVDAVTDIKREGNLAFRLGAQHDASELLPILMQATDMEESCCRVCAHAEDALPRRCQGALLLNYIEEGGSLDCVWPDIRRLE